MAVLPLLNSMLITLQGRRRNLSAQSTLPWVNLKIQCYVQTCILITVLAGWAL